MDLPADARFCFRCGTPATAPAPAPEERRIVSVVFCDLAGSTELSGMLDPELLRSVLLRYYALMTGVVEANGGIVEKFIGDAVMAVFGLTSTREDDARRALTAALDMTVAASRFSDELDREHGVRLRVRIGVHTGEVVATSDPSSRQALVSGEVVNVAARLETAAPIGEVLVSAAARHAAGGALTVADRQWLSLKGVGERVEAFRLVDVAPPDPELMRRFDVPFVGRGVELSALDAAWSVVRRDRRARLLTVLGEPGIGKTRLVREWLARGAVPAVFGRCRAHGDGGSLTALAECVAPLVDELGVPVDVAVAQAVTLLRAGLLRDGTPSPSVNDTGAAVAAVLTALCATRPLLLVLDDVHWAEPTLHAVLDRLLTELDGQPVLFVCLARPDDDHPSDGAGKPAGGASASTDTDSAGGGTDSAGGGSADAALAGGASVSADGWGAGTVLVGTLPRQEAELIAAGLVEVMAHDDDGALTRIVDQAGGNPLYLEQLAAAVHDDGVPVGHLPLTLRALVAARIDRLGDDERTALRHGALVGDGVGDFEPADVRELSDPATDPVTDPVADPALPRLARLRLVERAQDTRYRFVSGVTQQVAYEGLTKKRRGELHERYADHLTARQAPDPLVGNHLASAYAFQTAVGLAEDRRTALRRRACGHLLRGGALALRRSDLPWALTLLRRCAELAQPGDPDRPECLGLLGEVLLMLGRRDEAIDALHGAIGAPREATGEPRGSVDTPHGTVDALREAEAAAHPTVAAHARLYLAMTSHDAELLATVAGEVLPVFAAHGDHLGLARGGLIQSGGYQRAGRHTDALGILDRALDEALAAGADREVANTLGAIGLSLWHGPEPAGPAIARCGVLLAEHGTRRPAVRATMGFAFTMLHAVQGNTEEAAAACRHTVRAMSSMSYADSGLFRPLLVGLVAAASGAAAAARQSLREALDAADSLGAGSLALLARLELARVLLDGSDPPAAHRRAGPQTDAATGRHVDADPATGRHADADAGRHADAVAAAGRWEASALLEGVEIGDDLPAERAAYLGLAARLDGGDGALELARQAVLVSRRTDSPADQGRALLDMAHAAAALGEPDIALAAAWDAANRFAAKGHLVGESQARALLGRAAP